jgi:sporulation protein YlmC with PRC-barrel domain
MRGSRSLGLVLVAAALGATPALAAQQQNAAAPLVNAPANTAPAPLATMPPNANNETMANNGKGLSGSLEKYNGEWRTSKVVGATVYNSNGDSIGTIDDLLMDESGKISQAVVSTGGVLGMGGKLVAVPFDQLKFEPSAGNNGAPQAAVTPNAPVSVNPPAAGYVPPRAAANQAPSHPTYFSPIFNTAPRQPIERTQ